MLDSSRFGVIIRATTKKYSDNSLNQLIMGTFKKKVERKKTENSENRKMGLVTEDNQR